MKTIFFKKKGKLISFPNFFIFLGTLLISTVNSFALEEVIKFEGIECFNGYGGIPNNFIASFTPYNSIIIEAGAYLGAETISYANLYPKGKILVFEANPRVSTLLQSSLEAYPNVSIFNAAISDKNGVFPFYLCHGKNGSNIEFEFASSLIFPLRLGKKTCSGPVLQVQCFTIDEWCKANNISHVDVLRLDIEGMEYRSLKASPEILKKIKILHTHTNVKSKDHKSFTKFLKNSGFVLAAHYYYESKGDGQAIYLSRELFDAYFKLGLGWELGI